MKQDNESFLVVKMLSSYTYGFSLNLTVEIFQEHGFQVNRGDFKVELERQHICSQEVHKKVDLTLELAT